MCYCGSSNSLATKIFIILYKNSCCTNKMLKPLYWWHLFSCKSSILVGTVKHVGCSHFPSVFYMCERKKLSLIIRFTIALGRRSDQSDVLFNTDDIHDAFQTYLHTTRRFQSLIPKQRHTYVIRIHRAPFVRRNLNCRNRFSMSAERFDSELFSWSLFEFTRLRHEICCLIINRFSFCFYIIKVEISKQGFDFHKSRATMWYFLGLFASSPKAR